MEDDIPTDLSPDRRADLNRVLENERKAKQDRLKPTTRVPEQVPFGKSGIDESLRITPKGKLRQRPRWGRPEKPKEKDGGPKP